MLVFLLAANVAAIWGICLLTPRFIPILVAVRLAYIVMGVIVCLALLN